MTDAQTALAALNAAAQDVAAAVAEKDANLSRLSLQNDSLTAANVALQAQLDTANQTIAQLKAASNTVTAQADATGATIANAGIQSAIDKAQAGQTVVVPKGTYLIDPSASLKIKSGVTYDLTGAVLKVKANALSRCYVLYANGATDITIKGGEIQGDRLAHDYSGPTTEEWCHGAALYGVQRANVLGLKISQMPGDGLSISGSDILLDGVVSLQNRRQGLSIAGGASNRIKVHNSTFSQTGPLGTQAGTAPMAGVDIEPDTGNVDDVEFVNCTIADNATCGLQAWTRNNTPTMLSVTNVRVVDCTITGNANGVLAKSVSGKPMDVTVSQSSLGKNRGSNIRVESGATITANGNTFAAMTDRTDFTLTGQDSRTRYDIYVLTGGKAIVGTNSYV